MVNRAKPSVITTGDIWVRKGRNYSGFAMVRSGSFSYWELNLACVNIVVLVLLELDELIVC